MDTMQAVASENVGAVVHTMSDADEAHSLVESIQALLNAGEKRMADYLIRDLKALVSDLVAVYATGSYISGSASALLDAKQAHLWELSPDRVRRAIEIIEEYAEGREDLNDLSDATIFLNHVLELLGYDTSSSEIKKILTEGVTPDEAIHTALVALTVSVGGVAWNDEIKN